MSTPHTPGPWKIYTNSAIILGPDGREVALARCLAWPEPEAQANARLIAAAPELLSNCKILEPIHAAANRVLELYGAQYLVANGDGGRAAHAIKQLAASVADASRHYNRAAIAKAEGRQS